MTITNKMPRVFRAMGSVVQFHANGRLQAVEQSAYAELTNAIVPPRSELQVKIYGPPISDLPDKGIVGLFFYDVPTKTDDASAVTEKQNFEWYFDLTMKPESTQAAVVNISYEYVSQEQLRAYQQGQVPAPGTK